MGGAGIASSNSFYINQLNPASNINNNSVIYEFGILGQAKSINSSTASDNAMGGNLNYIGMMFPVKAKIIKGKRVNLWVMGGGLKPYSSVSYSNTYTDKISNDTSIASYVVKGNGGLNQVYWSNGIRLNKEWSIGLTSGYVFGPIKRESLITVDGSSVDVVQDSYLSSLEFKPAINYKKQISPFDSTETKGKTFLSIASTLDIFGNMNSSIQTETQRVRLSDGFIIRRDTLNQIDNVSSNLPITYNMGLALDNFGFNQVQKWSLAGDFSYSNWSKYKYLGSNAGLGNYYSVKLGGEYRPTYVATKSFLNRLTYRAGAYFIHTPVVYYGNEILDFGATIGLAFSISKTLANINWGLAVGQKGTMNNGAIQEQYIKMYIGVTINDIWFLKRQLN